MNTRVHCRLIYNKRDSSSSHMIKHSQAVHVCSLNVPDVHSARLYCVPVGDVHPSPRALASVLPYQCNSTAGHSTLRCFDDCAACS
jgi:hypothetical protein